MFLRLLDSGALHDDMFSFFLFIKVEPDQLFVYHVSSKACAAGYANSSAGAREAIDQDGNVYTVTLEGRKQMVNAR